MSGLQRTIKPQQPPRRREWTTKDAAYLRERYLADGCEAVANALNRSMSAIYQHARVLGLHRPRQATRGPFVRKYEITPQIDATLSRILTSGERGAVARAAKAIGRPRSWVKRRAQALGLTVPRDKEPDWTAAEMDLLRSSGAKSVSGVQQMLRRHGHRRTLSAIATKMRLQGVALADDDCLSVGDLAAAMGVDDATIGRWCRSLGLSFTERDGRKRFSRKDIRAFVVDNVAAVDLRKVEKHWFVDLLASKERER